MKESASTAHKEIYWVVSEIDRNNAGYRVRTLPIVEEMKAYGRKPILIPIKEFSEKLPSMIKDAKAVIVSKPSDTMSYLCIRHLASNGIKIVVDLFDNYFSWSPSLFQNDIPWHWLRILKACSMVMVSTDCLAQTVRNLGVNNVVCVGDLIPEIHGKKSRASIKKWEDKTQINLLWFGINANPFFQAGLEDLISWVSVVESIQVSLGTFCQIRLTICTKLVREVDIVIAAYRNAGIDVAFVPWTESSCNELLEKAHVVLLPSNMTGFSLSKTHNRCSDALARNCLVLSSPNGPYQGIPGAVYFSPSGLCQIIKDQDVINIKHKIEESLAYLRDVYEPEASISKLMFRLLTSDKSQVSPAQDNRDVKFLLLAVSSINVVKMSRVMGYLVCHFAGTPMTWTFDFMTESFDSVASSVTIALSEKGKAALQSKLSVISTHFDDDEQQNSWRQHGWTVTLDAGSNKLVLVGEELRNTLARMREMTTVGFDHALLYRAWIDINIGLLSLLLVRLGFTNLELAADRQGGWESYANIVDAELAGTAMDLKSFWSKYPGNETAWIKQKKRVSA